MSEESRASVRFNPEAGVPGNGVEIDLSLVIAELQALNAKLDVLKPCICEPEPESNIIVAYPRTGGLQTLQSGGITTLSYITGIVTHPDGTTEHLARRLAAAELYKSAHFYATKTLNVTILDGGVVRLATPIYPGLTSIVNISFDRIDVVPAQNAADEIPDTAQIYLAVAIGPQGVPRIDLSSFKEGNPYIDRHTFVLGTLTVTRNVFGTLGRNAHDGYITNMGIGAGLLQVEFNDGITTSWSSTFITIEPNGTFTIVDEDIAQLRITTDIVGTQYEIYLS